MTQKPPRTLAERADPHALYQEAVQCAEAEIDFVDEIFMQLRGRRAGVLREDFCGTAKVACEWAARRRDNLAIGVDRDAAVLDWARRHNLARLPLAHRGRVRLLQADVLTVCTEPVDAVVAMNFSYWIFKERAILQRYFQRIRRSLVRDGILFLDAYGGYEAFKLLTERTRYDGYIYIWDQAAYNPITGAASCHIDFRFADGSTLRRAFSYHWRLWTLPELREVLLEAGFERVTVYWQGSDPETGEGDGEFYPTEVGEPDAGWIAYLVAEK